MNLNQAAKLMRLTREGVIIAITDGIELPKSKEILYLDAAPIGTDYDIEEHSLDRFFERLHTEEPGRHPPTNVRRKLLVEANHRCAICREIAPIEFHHIIEFSKIKNYDVRYMLALCPNCHTLCTRGEIDIEMQTMYKQRLSNMQPQTLIDEALPMRVGELALVNSEKLDRIRRLSWITAKDAANIAEDTQSGEGGQIRLEQNLYVNRSLEQYVLKLIEPGTSEVIPNIVVIIGGAGSGKTSLLWYLHQTLTARRNTETWFIKSTFFRSITGPDHYRTQELTVLDLEKAAALAKDEGRHPIVLLDTIDLLLHNETDRQWIVETLSRLQTAGCSVVATSRPLEATALRPFGFKQLLLRDYDERELEDAVYKYAMRLCTATKSKRFDEHVNRIKTAVAHGLPIREVCTNPLTLRMLFILYAPEEVPTEINVFRLYEDYWNMRVKSDRRAGGSYIPDDSKDLSKITMAIALTMLAEGTPEIGYNLIGQLLDRYGYNIHDLDILTSRAIIQRSDAQMLHFLHQTFFEHSAGRGFIDFFGETGILTLEKQLNLHPNDLFTYPVYEQALLLSQSQPKPIRQAAETAFQRLVNSNSSLPQSSAAYVYAHSSNLSSSSKEAVRKMLPIWPTATIRRLLDLSPNIPHHRIHDMFIDYDIIWQRKKWPEQYEVLEKLERFVVHSPNEVRSFIHRHKIHQELINGMPPLGYQSVLKTILFLVSNEPNLDYKDIIQCLLSHLSSEVGPDIKARILEVLCKYGETNRKLDTILCECESALGARDDMHVGVALGHLYAMVWQKNERAFDAITKELDSVSKFFFESKLRGLADYITTFSEKDAEIAWTYYITQSSIQKQQRWTDVILPQWMQGNVPKNGLNCDTEHEPLSESVIYIRRQIAQIFADCAKCQLPCGTSFGYCTKQAIFLQLSRAVRNSHLSSEVLLDLLTCDGLTNVNPWLDENRFCRLLVPAFSDGHPYAIQAMQLFVDNPSNYSYKVRESISNAFTSLQQPGDDHARIAIKLLINMKLEVQLLRFIENNSAVINSSCPDLWNEIDEFRRILVDSRSGKKRRSGFRLWTELLKIGRTSPESIDDLTNRINDESDERSLAHLALLIGHSASSDKYALENVVRTLLPLCQSRFENVREKSLLGISIAIRQTNEDPSPFAKDLLSAALRPPTNGLRLTTIGFLIEGLLDHNISLAAEILEALLLSKEATNLGEGHAKNDMIVSFRNPVRNLVRLAPSTICERLLEIVVNLGRQFGRIIIDAICVESFDKYSEKLNWLLEHPNVHSQTKELIRRHKFIRERMVGNDGWPDLYKQVFPTP